MIEPSQAKRRGRRRDASKMRRRAWFELLPSTPRPIMTNGNPSGGGSSNKIAPNPIKLHPSNRIAKCPSNCLGQSARLAGWDVEFMSLNSCAEVAVADAKNSRSCHGPNPGCQRQRVAKEPRRWLVASSPARTGYLARCAVQPAHRSLGR